MASVSITPIKLGLKFNPPALILVYRDKGKLRSRTIPTKNLDILSDLRLYAEKFKTDLKYKKYFDKISNLKLEKMFFILQDNMKGYNLKESLERAKKYDKSLDDTDILSELNSDNNKSKNKENDYDDDDFHDTEDEEDKNPPSVSTIEDVKAKKDENIEKKSSLFETRKIIDLDDKDNQKSKETFSKSVALDLLSSQMKAVKSNFYDFEDEVEDEVGQGNDDDDDDDDDDEDEHNILNFAKKKNKKEDEKLETAENDDDSNDSF